MINGFSIAGAIVTAVLSIGLPFLLLGLLQWKTKKALIPALVGAGCFVVFALVLEQLVHVFVIPLVMNTPWLYAAYGCFAAGLFEETGRLAGLTYLCKKRDASLGTGLAYGVGHGGIEAIVLVGLSAISNLAVMLQYQSGAMSSAMQSVGAQLAAMPPEMFWWGGIERVIAIAFHIALSMLIWMVVTKRVPFWFYPIAILLHALANTPAMLHQFGVGPMTNIAATEALMAIVTMLIWALVLALYFRTRAKPATARELPEVAAEPAATEPTDVVEPEQ